MFKNKNFIIIVSGLLSIFLMIHPMAKLTFIHYPSTIIKQHKLDTSRFIKNENIKQNGEASFKDWDKLIDNL
ncbi:MAG: hypothetical protein Q8934_05650 [Bacillota bacterium]|nr:hypothetical protein [Bacillota bacterium]